MKVTLLPGDGIGAEVLEAAMRVAEAVASKYGVSFETTEELIGGASLDAKGVPVTDEALQTCLDSDVTLLGAVGGPKWESVEHRLKPEAALLKLRKTLELFSNVRPAKVYAPLLGESSLKAERLDGADFVVMRELTGGIYFGEPRGLEDTRGFNTMVYETAEVERIARKAFEIARLRGKKVVSVDKANVLECSQLWRNTVTALGEKDYADVELSHMYVDNAAMQIVRDPRQFDVILTSNMFGDILSDIAGMITGSLGMLPSASLGEKHALYEPVHGSAPDIAGQGIANPVATIASIAMMFKYTLELVEAADLIEQAIEQALLDGYRTKDVYSEGKTLVGTNEMTDAIVERFEELHARKQSA
ncbi:MAG: 3-isopropylmalate dehydrogenase [Ignavibacteriales bacterium]|nr:3-isopropylmalate dehydrogenase [Ignavibacteriales bacterium]